jgi:hypothetical protein
MQIYLGKSARTEHPCPSVGSFPKIFTLAIIPYPCHVMSKSLQQGEVKDQVGTIYQTQLATRHIY